MILAVFFVMGFTLCFVSAPQSPTLHGVNVAVAGPAAQTAPLRAGPPARRRRNRPRP
jgi:hypothetical protein